jgi:hypothetical protein
MFSCQDDHIEMTAYGEVFARLVALACVFTRPLYLEHDPCTLVALMQPLDLSRFDQDPGAAEATVDVAQRLSAAGSTAKADVHGGAKKRSAGDDWDDDFDDGTKVARQAPTKVVETMSKVRVTPAVVHLYLFVRAQRIRAARHPDLSPLLPVCSRCLLLPQIRVRCHVEFVDVEGRADREAMVNLMEVRCFTSKLARLRATLHHIAPIVPTLSVPSECVCSHDDSGTWLGEGDGGSQSEVFNIL